MANHLLEDERVLGQFCQVIATDLRLLADLHASELTRERMRELLDIGFPGLLALGSYDHTLALAVEQLGVGMASWPNPIPDSLVDDLAADFADIYLNGSLHGLPNESVWLDDEELTCQQPMFEVREWYARHNLAVPNWRKLSDDHLVNELLFIAYLLDKVSSEQDSQVLEEVAQFMDEHLLRWLLPFGKRVALRCATPFYSSLALTSALYVEQLRELIAMILGVARPSIEAIELKLRTQQLAASGVQPLRYYPGSAPSW
ncbi:TorD/DmsD family molecular chaperone [Thiofilum flexile]|uniref:TorD/DmsD family molecular chaperone n=1 Tax=Thiofilum flexile TaxID=125627 RepID=UPI0003755E42|nr:molecular chaperone TorD family protein [Thiofilum flexile]